MAFTREGLRTIGAFTLLGLIFFAIFTYLAGFSTQQSAVMALLIVWLDWMIEVRALAPRMKLRPYYVFVRPHWWKILSDFKLIGREEEWQYVCELVERLSNERHCVLRDGLSFTVVSESEDFKETLIFSNSHRAFVSKLRFFEDLRPIHIENDAPTVKSSEDDYYLQGLGERSIWFFLEPGKGGYNLGIQVPHKWWNTVSQGCPKPMEEKDDHFGVYVSLILATISYHEFDMYWQPVEWNETFYFKTAKETRKRVEQERTKLGWKSKEESVEDPPGMPETIEHMYFTIDHNAI